MASDRRPKISIIIPNLNGEHLLGACLASLKRQSYQDFELVLVDNASQDNSLSLVASEYPLAAICRFSENQGFSRAVNKGFSLARGAYIFLLNNDTELDPDCLKNLNDFLDERPDLSFAAAKMLFFDDRQIINNAGDTLSIYGLAHQRGKGELDRGQYQKAEPIFSACAGGAMYRRELLERLNGFAENFWAYLEDVDLGFRAQLLGCRGYLVPRAVIYHLDGGTSKKTKNLVNFLTIRNSLYLVYRNYPLSLLVLLAPCLLVSQARNIMSGLKHHYLPEVFRAYRDFIRALPELSRERRAIQKSRVISSYQVFKLLSKKYPFSFKRNLYGLLHHHRQL